MTARGSAWERLAAIRSHHNTAARLAGRLLAHGIHARETHYDVCRYLIVVQIRTADGQTLGVSLDADEVAAYPREAAAHLRAMLDATP